MVHVRVNCMVGGEHVVHVLVAWYAYGMWRTCGSLIVLVGHGLYVQPQSALVVTYCTCGSLGEITVTRAGRLVKF